MFGELLLLELKLLDPISHIILVRRELIRCIQHLIMLFLLLRFNTLLALQVRIEFELYGSLYFLQNQPPDVLRQALLPHTGQLSHLELEHL